MIISTTINYSYSMIKIRQTCYKCGKNRQITRTITSFISGLSHREFVLNSARIRAEFSNSQHTNSARCGRNTQVSYQDYHNFARKTDYPDQIVLNSCVESCEQLKTPLMNKTKKKQYAIAISSRNVYRNKRNRARTRNNINLYKQNKICRIQYSNLCEWRKIMDKSRQTIRQ